MAASTQLRRNLEAALAKRDNPGSSVELAQLVGAVPIRASGIKSCGRRQTYSAKGTVRTASSSESLLQMIQGDWGEEGMKKLLVEAGYQFRDEQRELSYYENGQEVLRGHIDGLIKFDTGLITSQWHLWENKLMSAYRYRKLCDAGTMVTEAPEYYAQLQIYMGLLRSDGEDINSSLFTAVAKDPSAVNVGRGRGPKQKARLNPLFVEEVPFNQRDFDSLLYRASDLHSFVRQGALYPRERIPGKDWDCSPRFCPFYNECDPEAAIRSKAA
jgi:hypothetical protein